MKIYLAGPFFNPEERQNVEKARDVLRNRGFEVFVPMEHKLEDDDKMPNDEWGRRVFEMDRDAIWDCEIMVVMYYGLYSDSGTAWEVGYANCLNKKIVVVHLDKVQESSLMVVNGSSANIGSIEQLENFDFENIKNNFLTHTEQK